MPKKYLSQEEAAAELGVTVEQLKSMREQGDIRGFADRGTWKFKLEDVQELARSRQPTSDPEIPLLSDSAIDPSDGGEDEVGSKATVIRGGGSVLDDDDEPRLPSPSDSDVRLILDDSVESDGGSGTSAADSDVPLVDDSDVKFVGGDAGIDVENEVSMFEDSDSDVRLAAADDLLNTSDSDSDVRIIPPTDEGTDSDVRVLSGDSDSDVRLAPSASGLLDDSDSDVKLVPPTGAESSLLLGGSDSDVKLIGDSGPGLAGSDSDVKLIGSDSGVDDGGSDSDVALVAGDGSGLFIGDDDESSVFAPEDDGGEDSSSMTIAAGSGILSPDDSGINLEVGGGSGVILDDEDDSPSYAPSEITANFDDDELVLGDDDESEITLGDEPSSISLDSVALAGESDTLDETMPELDAPDFEEDEDDQTAFDMPAVAAGDEDTYQFDLADDQADSNVIAFDDEEADDHAATVVQKGAAPAVDDEETFDLAQDDFEDEFDDDFDEFDEDELEVAADIEGEDDELDDLDVFDEADGFDEDFDVGGTVAPAGGVAATLEAEWGALPFTMLLFSFFALVVGGMMMYDLVRNMWAAGGPTTTGTDLLDWFAANLFGG